MNIRKFFATVGIVFAQLVMTQIVTFILSLIIPMEDYPQTQPILFALFLGIAFSLGIFSVGWFALRQGWLTSKPNPLWRGIATLVGAYIPLMLALFLYKTLEPGNPFFAVSILTGILGFYVPGWFDPK